VVAVVRGETYLNGPSNSTEQLNFHAANRCFIGATSADRDGLLAVQVR
jgi:hypothetical protein